MPAPGGRASHPPEVELEMDRLIVGQAGDIQVLRRPVA
jgi:hypothetical protein